MAGSGIRTDPWIVESYAELVAKAALDGYVKIGRDINITDEYLNVSVLHDTYGFNAG